MLAFTRESFGEVEATLRKKTSYKIASDEHRRIKNPAVSFDTARDVHSVADHREFKPIVGANIALYNLAAMDTDGNANGHIGVFSMLFIPTAKTLMDLQCTERRVCCILLAGNRRAEHGHETVPEELIYRALAYKDGLAEQA